MKRFFRLTLMLLTFLQPAIAVAFDSYFEVDGICYYTFDNNAKVARNYYVGYGGDVTIPNVVTYNGTNYTVTAIDDEAFAGFDVTSVDIPNSVTAIGNRAFSGCDDLTSIDIPKSVTSIGAEAFYGCYSLTSVCINDIAAWCGISFKSNDANPLYYAHHLYLNDSEVTELIIPDNVNVIGDFAFADCYGITRVSIPDSVTSIGIYAFYNCISINGPLRIPNSVTAIGNRAFSGCDDLTSIDIPKSVTSIGAGAFYGCYSLTSVCINDIAAWCGISFKSNDANPLYYAHHLYLNDTEVTELIIPDEVTAIGDWAFADCSGLTSVSIPKSVTQIGKQAFKNGPSIESVVCKAETPPSWNGIDMFTTNVYNHSPLYVPVNSKNAYISDQCWGQFSTINGYVNEDNPFEDAEYMKCDVNSDGKIDIIDVITVIQALLNH